MGIDSSASAISETRTGFISSNSPTRKYEAIQARIEDDAQDCTSRMMTNLIFFMGVLCLNCGCLNTPPKMKDITDFINDRLASQFFGSYIVAFATVHYEILMKVLFDATKKIPEKIEAIQTYTLDYGYWWVPIIPFLWSMVILIVYKTGNALAEVIGKQYQIWNARIGERQIKGSTVDIEVVHSLRTRNEELLTMNNALSDQVDKVTKEKNDAVVIADKMKLELSDAKVRIDKKDKTIDKFEKVIQDQLNEIADMNIKFDAYDASVYNVMTSYLRVLNDIQDFRYDKSIRIKLNVIGSLQRMKTHTGKNKLKSVIDKIEEKFRQ